MKLLPKIACAPCTVKPCPSMSISPLRRLYQTAHDRNDITISTYRIMKDAVDSADFYCPLSTKDFSHRLQSHSSGAHRQGLQYLRFYNDLAAIIAVQRRTCNRLQIGWVSKQDT